MPTTIITPDQDSIVTQIEIGAPAERVFQAFHRAGSDAARTGGGAGLGLAISRAIVEAHGGKIWLADANAGTRVRFSLPAAR